MSENPKESCSSVKAQVSSMPLTVMMEVGIGMMEGAAKYGAFNYRHSQIKASTYIDALFRHIVAWYEGEDIDEESGLSHVTKAICTLVVLRDAEASECLIDDRPIIPAGVSMKYLNSLAKAVVERHGE